MNKPTKQPTKKTFWSKLSTNTLVRFLLFAACGWVLVKVFWYFKNVVFIFTFATILALILNYPVRYLERFVRRGFALGTVMVISLLTIIFLFLFVGNTLVTQIQQLAGLLLQIINSSNNPVNELQSALAARNIQINLETVETQIRNWVVSGINIMLSFLPNLLESYVGFIIIIVVAFFILTDGEKIWQLILNKIPDNQRDRFATAIQKNFIGFLRGQLLISLILSIATFLVFALFHIPFPFLLAITVGLFDLIPGIGATLGVSLVSLIVLVQSGWFISIKVLISCIVLQQIQDNLIAPRVMQSTVHLNPLVVFFALLIGTQIAGLLGVFLSIPIAGVIVSLLEIEELQAN
ncbi:AI-2E family transporter [Nostoc sp. 'Peltigera membranacea cyanobiont' 210A]|uniref:AI-2E family transporter n=1 Tax=Nostoc sp. 'Peltigera membranacea cyanobiont' 210A TaxID=2014529 RepID=UPI000B953756|nr:AI-2E family transporter [Nostoc sp. 'Peltigera membranacea cyanobiont' 210A]OYD91546.1 AI-2E family transporter [Nostoc sp. 'Peltigera membranacea cyanobiont' 210A]